MLAERTNPGLHAALFPVVTKLEGISSDSPILDVACGTGAWLKRLHDAGHRELWGIDRDEGSFGGADFAHFVRSDLDKGDLIGVPRSKFSLVTMIEIIEHLGNPEGLVRLGLQALAPRGWLLITTPNIYSLRARMRFLLNARLPGFEQQTPRIPVELDHIHPFVLAAYKRKIIDRLNLSLVRVWTHPENQGGGSRAFASVVTKTLRLLLPDDLPGDTLCLLLRKD